MQGGSIHDVNHVAHLRSPSLRHLSMRTKTSPGKALE